MGWRHFNPTFANSSTGPRSVAQRYLYSAPAIVYACALRAFDKLTVGAVRKRVGVGARQSDNNHGRWYTPGRWMAAIANGRLLQGLDLKTTVTKLTASFCERILALTPLGRHFLAFNGHDSDHHEQDNKKENIHKRV